MLTLENSMRIRMGLDRQTILINETGDKANDFDIGVGRDPIYYDWRLAKDSRLSQGISAQMGKAFADFFAEHLARNGISFDAVVPVPRGGVPFAEALAIETETKFICLEKGPERTIGGFAGVPPPKGLKIVVVENVTVTGSMTLKTIDFLRKWDHECRIVAVFCDVDREFGAADAVATKELHFASALLHSEVVKFLIEKAEAPVRPCIRSLMNLDRIKKTIQRRKPLEV